MPQMGPLNWFMLMIYFSMLMLMYNTFIYSMFSYTIKNQKKNKIKMNWKW
uniref:ATP synthase F0 subunit 8 n=1 Tax=Pyrocoelia analis TaxID=1453205 RepID=A0A8K1RGT7_9COLE|nr:ATP synthase F0 subunit 8 [Pyrocoelia analis]UEN67844.1 ATP synthase F0 subunit 8 [Pyrocoelia analis]UZG66110.1 ATP synthase F0 subunit 8 [Pyrocoelia analis]